MLNAGTSATHVNQPVWHRDPDRLLRYRLHRLCIGDVTQIPPELGGGLVRRTMIVNDYQKARQAFLVTQNGHQYHVFIRVSVGKTYVGECEKFIHQFNARMLTKKGKK